MNLEDNRIFKNLHPAFAVIAEILAERIADNMMKQAKDGRWLGGNISMGFAAQRISTGSGKL